MNQATFTVFLLLPSVGLAYIVLATFYGSINAYTAISWIPITLFVLLKVFIGMNYAPKTPDLTLLLNAAGWISLVQAIFGGILTLVAIIEKRRWPLALFATAVTAIPFFLID